MFCGNDEKKKEAKAILADLYAVYGNVYKMLCGNVKKRNDEKKKETVKSWLIYTMFAKCFC